MSSVPQLTLYLKREFIPLVPIAEFDMLIGKYAETIQYLSLATDE